MIRYGLTMRIDGDLIAATPFYRDRAEALAAAIILQDADEEPIALVEFHREGEGWIVADTTRIPERSAA